MPEKDQIAVAWVQNIPTEPQDCPGENKEKELHRADMGW